MPQLLKQPITHFAILAGLIFLAYHIFNDGSDSKIYVTQAEISRLSSIYESEMGYPPSSTELSGLVDEHIRKQALIAEAKALGLDEGDVIIERRLAQKMNFMIADIHEAPTPSAAELEAWFETHKENFNRPELFTFQHVFFTQNNQQSVSAVLEKLNDNVEWKSLGDPFMLQREYSQLPEREVTRIFGQAFSNGLKGLDLTSMRWQGPVKSALGIHIIRIVDHEAPVPAELNHVKNPVTKAWQEQASRERSRKDIKRIVDKYEIVIEGESE